LTTIAALVLFTGCGGGSGNTGHSAPRARGLVGLGLARVVSAKQGAFRTVIPLGYSYNASETQYDIEGTGALDGILVVVVREPAQLGDINAFARRLVASARRVPSIHRISRPSALSVGGEPALALEYAAREKIAAAGGRRPRAAPARPGWEESALRSVFVRHGRFVYIIRAAWRPGQHAPASAALEQVLSNWQWQ
jgi:hypothetical protein